MQVRRELGFEINGINDIEYDVVASDVIKMKLMEKKTGVWKPLLLCFLWEDTVVGLTSSCAFPYVNSSIQANLQFAR